MVDGDSHGPVTSVGHSLLFMPILFPRAAPRLWVCKEHQVLGGNTQNFGMTLTPLMSRTCILPPSCLLQAAGGRGSSPGDRWGPLPLNFQPGKERGTMVPRGATPLPTGKVTTKGQFLFLKRLSGAFDSGLKGPETTLIAVTPSSVPHSGLSC